MYIGGNTATIVANRNGFIRMNGNPDFTTVSRQGLVDRVIHQLKHHMVQTCSVIGIADIHARTLAHGIQALQDLDTRRIVSLFAHCLLRMISIVPVALAALYRMRFVSRETVSTVPSLPRLLPKRHIRH